MFINKNNYLYGGYVFTNVPFYLRLHIKSFYPPPFRFTQNGGFILEKI